MRGDIIHARLLSCDRRVVTADQCPELDLRHAEASTGLDQLIAGHLAGHEDVVTPGCHIDARDGLVVFHVFRLLLDRDCDDDGEHQTAEEADAGGDVVEVVHGVLS